MADAHPTYRILLVDDQPLVASAVRDLFAGEDDLVLHAETEAAAAVETAVAFRPDAILQDLSMPDADGMTLLEFYRAHDALSSVPVLILSAREEPETKARAFALGASDYLVKLPERVEFLARIRHHAQAYQDASRRAAAEAALRRELDEAGAFVRSLLPPPVKGKSDWTLAVCSALGGDVLDLFPLSGGREAFYVLDVCGHGVGSALLATAVLLGLRARSLPDADYANPASVLSALARAFPSGPDGKFFTCFYGVADAATRRIRYASAGHPPALFLPADDPAGAVFLEGSAPPLGVLGDFPYSTKEFVPSGPGRLLVFSDGCYEFERADGSRGSLGQFRDFFVSRPDATGAALLARVRELTGRDALEDDFTFLSLSV
jgi:sigma-B regulation protein RsbU (phosphoserine phosphatase)